MLSLILFQGVPSWKWFYPYHYAPFASDFMNVGDFKIDFDVETKPVEPIAKDYQFDQSWSLLVILACFQFNPLEQLMGVFPAASCRHIPKPWAELMLDSVKNITIADVKI